MKVIISYGRHNGESKTITHKCSSLQEVAMLYENNIELDYDDGISFHETSMDIGKCSFESLMKIMCA